MTDTDPGRALGFALLLSGVLAADSWAEPRAESPVVPHGGAVLMDGRCREWADSLLVAEVEGWGRLRAKRNGDLLAFCIDVPGGGVAAADLLVDAPGLTSPLALHVSAQAGERALGADGWPEWEWWNEREWAGTVAGYARVDTTEEGCKPRFRNRGDKEIVLSLSRFGRGNWRVAAIGSGVLGADRSRRARQALPASAEDTQPETWIELRVPAD